MDHNHPYHWKHHPLEYLQQSENEKLHNSKYSTTEHMSFKYCSNKEPTISNDLNNIIPTLY